MSALRILALLNTFFLVLCFESYAQRPSPCVSEYPEDGRLGFYDTLIVKYGWKATDQSLDYENSVFTYGEKVYFIDLDLIAPTAYCYSKWEYLVCLPEAHPEKKKIYLSYNVYALKSSGLSHRPGEIMDFHDGKKYTFFAESKRGTWLMHDENNKCYFYKPPVIPPPHSRKPRLAPIKIRLTYQ
jgi:hypothetical protein